ncbi:MAG: hypothetical protein NZL87_09720 [Thermomicrobium sp.]|nr:hypothetical protein [Thermomicrobium sp.]MDW7981690.1 hypothetical protein [Thermomicrobium sp.]
MNRERLPRHRFDSSAATLVFAALAATVTGAPEGCFEQRTTQRP